MIVFLTKENNVSISVNDAVKAPVESTLTETGIDLTAAFGCIIWIDSTTGKISATTYQNGEMIPVQIKTTDPEKEALNRFADSLYS